MRNALILTWSRFQDHEVIYPYYALQEHNFSVKVLGDVTAGTRMYGDLGAHIVCNFSLIIPSFKDPYKHDKFQYLENFRKLYEDANLLVIPGGVSFRKTKT